MLSCRACLLRCIQALDTSPSTTHRLRRNATSALQLGQQRLFLQTSTRTVAQVGVRPAALADEGGLSTPDNDSWKTSSQATSLRSKEKKSLTQQHPAAQTDQGVDISVPRKLGRRDPSVSAKDFNRRRRELQYLSDPLELATFVKNELLKDKATEMVQLVRMASHSMQCVVSWNHVIDYYLAKGRVAQALKVYNDMKKRAQFPDSYTYTILLRGLAKNAHESGALGKALSVYHSMSAPNARVEPSIIHTNAVLKVCARALDMDALWGVAAKIPDKGAGAANAITYSTILNAVRQSLLVDIPAGETAEQVAIRRERGIMEGRRVWQDITTRWRNADLVIGEELVCAMGRLLLVGARPRDWDDVLSLVEQTMDIPRLVPRLGTTARAEAGLPRLRTPNVPQQFRFDDDHLNPIGAPARGEEFLPLAVHGVGGAVSSPLNYATPSNNTLSMIQEACQKIVANKAADEYWELLTDPTTYAVLPDTNNLNARLRVLRQNRASASALKILQSEFMAKGLKPHPGTFRIAMSTCVRDKNNHNSLKHASEILYMMTKIMEDVDPKSVTMYAELALTFPLAKGSDLVDALVRLQPVIQNIKLQLGVGAAPKGGMAGAFALKGAAREDAVLALRKIYGVMDKLILSDMISEEQKRPHKEDRARLSAYIRRVVFKDGSGKWDKVREALEKHSEPALETAPDATSTAQTKAEGSDEDPNIRKSS